MFISNPYKQKLVEKMKYLFYWKRDGFEGIAWRIRGILPDGTFYGELRFDSGDPAKRKLTFLEGSISSEDWPRVQELLSFFNTPVLSENPSFAIIAKWEGMSLNDGQVTFRYNLGDEALSEDAKRFLELHDLLEKEVSKSYEKIT